MTRPSIPVILKEAADWMVKALRNGTLALDDVAAATKKLNLKPRFIADIGTGIEGTAKLMTDPRHGVSVHKAYDTRSGIFSDQQWERKIKTLVGAESAKNPLFARYYGQVPNKAVTRHEYIGKLGPKGALEGESGVEAMSQLIKSNPQYQRGYRKALKMPRHYGYDAIVDAVGELSHDPLSYGNPGNVLLNAKGKPKIIDFTAARLHRRKGSQYDSTKFYGALENNYAALNDAVKSGTLNNSQYNNALEIMSRGLRRMPTEQLAYNYDPASGEISHKLTEYLNRLTRKAIEEARRTRNYGHRAARRIKNWSA